MSISGYPLMNGVNTSYCFVDGHSYNGNRYKVGVDENGNSILTGEGTKDNRYKFTCVETEVYALTLL